MKILFLILIFQVFLFSDNKDSNIKDTTLLENVLQKSEFYREHLSQRLMYYATDIDSFLSNEPNDDTKKNASYVHLQFATEKGQDDKLKNLTTFRIRLELPKFKNKYRLELGNKEETNDKSSDIRANDISRNDDVQIGLRYINSLRNYFNYSVGAGVRFKLNEVDPYIKAKATKDFSYSNDWEGAIAQKFYFSNKKNLESISSYEVYKVFNETFKFSNFNEYIWKQKEPDDNFYNSLRLFQNLSKKDFLSYILSTTTDIDNSNLEIRNYQAYISYRHYIKKWLYYDVIPRYIWQRDKDFDPKYAIRFNFGMFIGKK